MLALERYETLFQLAAGLNFAYASLEIILKEPLFRVARRHADLVVAIKSGKPAAKIQLEFGLTAAAYNRVKPRLVWVNKVSKWLEQVNPYLSIASGLFAIWELYLGTVCPNACLISPDQGLGLLMVSYGWLAVSLLLMLFLRIYLLTAIEKHFEDSAK